MNLQTFRLHINPFSLEDLQAYPYAGNPLNIDAGESERIKHTIITEILPALEQDLENNLFHTIWLVREKKTNKIIADLRFKGTPDENGEIEIGYGTYSEFQGRGFMTEAVGALIAWAFQQEKVKAIIAETLIANVSSHKILQKNLFIKGKQLDGYIYWRLDRTTAHRG